MMTISIMGQRSIRMMPRSKYRALLPQPTKVKAIVNQFTSSTQKESWFHHMAQIQSKTRRI